MIAQIFLVNLAFRFISSQMILLNSTFQILIEPIQFKDFIPQKFSFQKEKVILVTLNLQTLETETQRMQVCSKNLNCISDKNAIDFRKNTQNIRVMNQSEISNEIQAQYNTISYQEDLSIKIRSQSTFQILVQLVDINFCPEVCQNQGVCRLGICICQYQFIGSDCQFPVYQLMNAEILEYSKYFYINIDEMKNDDKLVEEDFSLRLDQNATIIVQCLAINPYLQLNESLIRSSSINISRTDLVNCNSHYFQLKQQEVELIPYLLIKLIYPNQVKIILRTSNISFEPLVIGLIVGCVFIFLLFVLIFGIYRCKKDEKEKARLDAEKLQKQLEEAKQEALQNSYMPIFAYSEAIKKFPGLKNDKECEICLSLFKDDDEVRVTYCTHIFHLHCLKSWLLKHLTCPMCRQSLDVKIIAQSQLSSHEQDQMNPQSFNNDLLFTPKSTNQARLFASSEIDDQMGTNQQQKVDIFVYQNNENKEQIIEQSPK